MINGQSRRRLEKELHNEYWNRRRSNNGHFTSKVGVKLTTEKGIGSSNVEGLVSKGNGVYVNEAYDKADVVLEVNSELGIGEITFKLDW